MRRRCGVLVSTGSMAHNKLVLVPMTPSFLLCSDGVHLCLLQARRSKVKICDLGSAMLAGENERTPYLVSRFYRSPEVVLGLAYGER
jgi:serine/threonine protein kinase